METTFPVRSTLSAIAALVATVIAIGLVFVAGPAAPAAVAMALLGAAFFGLSAIPAVRAHPAYSLLNAAYVAALSAFWYLVVHSSPGTDGSIAAVIGAFAVLAVGGLLVELYNYRHDTRSLRLG